MRDIFYINKKLGFYGNDAKTSSSGSSSSSKNRNLKDEALHRQTRDLLDFLTDEFVISNNSSSQFRDDLFAGPNTGFGNVVPEKRKKLVRRNLDTGLKSFSSDNKELLQGGHQDKIFDGPQISENLFFVKSSGAAGNSPFQKKELLQKFGRHTCK